MADITLMKTPAETKLADLFTAVDAGPRKADREAAFARFAEKGLPHRRIEAWHYTDLRALLREALPPAPAAVPGSDALAEIRSYLAAHAAADARIVLIDGTFMPSLSTVDALPAGAGATSLLDALAAGTLGGADIEAVEALGTAESMLALNAAFMQGGAVISVPEGAAIGTVEILAFASATAPASSATRSVFIVGKGASLDVVERHIALGEAAHQGNHALLFAVGDGARLDHAVVVEGFAATALHVGTVLARLGSEARFSSFTLAAVPGIMRRSTFLEFAGEHSSSWLGGVSLLDGRAHADTTLVVTHTAQHCESREYYKTILDGESTGVYQGKVVVSPGAQKTDGKMLSKAIFLSEGASMFNKPELEIFADDVVCGHGATVGNLDDDQLFYLRARGIPVKEAQSLLLNAFAADAIEEVSSETLRDELTGSVEQWLRKRQS